MHEKIGNGSEEAGAGVGAVRTGLSLVGAGAEFGSGSGSGSDPGTAACSRNHDMNSFSHKLLT
jgi:hypothetical protein